MIKTNTAEMDIVYTVKPSEENEELRYSLRSLKNIPHRNVYFVGYKPSWVSSEVIHIDHPKVGGGKIRSTNSNWLRVATTKDVSKLFVLFNDDFFVLKPVSKLPFMHLGSHAKFAKYYQDNHPLSSYTKVINNTTQRLTELGIEEAFSYELHIPTIISKQAVRLALFKSNFKFSPLNVRTIALSLMEVGGKKVPDVKFYSNHEVGKNPVEPLSKLTFVSTMDGAWDSKVGEFVKSKFKEKCKYEK